jgi:hypothetical protein
MSPSPWFANWSALITSTGAGVSAAERAARREPVTTTSSMAKPSSVEVLSCALAATVGRTDAIATQDVPNRNFFMVSTEPLRVFKVWFQFFAANLPEAQRMHSIPTKTDIKPALGIKRSEKGAFFLWRQEKLKCVVFETLVNSWV